MYELYLYNVLYSVNTQQYISTVILYIQSGHSNKETENNTTKHISHNDNYVVSILKKKISKTKHEVQKEKSYTNKWTKYTYIGKETKFITKLFKDSSIKVTLLTYLLHGAESFLRS